MPQKISTADRIIEICNQFGVSIFLDGTDEHDSAKIGASYTYQEDDKILTIFLLNLRPNTWEKLKPFLKDKWKELGIVFTGKKESVLESFIEYEEKRPDGDLIDFYRDRIPSKDLDVLELSLYLRNEKDKGNSIDEFKQDIWNRFEERGVYISNLCNSGYFEEDFMTAAKKMGKTEYGRYYELMVGKELKAIFVHSNLKAPEFRDKFEDKLINARRYQINTLRIHGFGSWNVNLIKNFFNSYKHDEDGMWDEFELHTIEYSQYPPSLIYEIVLKDISKA